MHSTRSLPYCGAVEFDHVSVLRFPWSRVCGVVLQGPGQRIPDILQTSIRYFSNKLSQWIVRDRLSNQTKVVSIPRLLPRILSFLQHHLHLFGSLRCRMRGNVRHGHQTSRDQKRHEFGNISGRLLASKLRARLWNTTEHHEPGGIVSSRICGQSNGVPML